MNRFSSRIGVAFVFFAAFAGRSAQAALIVPGTTDLTGAAIQDLTLLPNTPFNPGPVPIFLPGVTGLGTITLNRNAQVGNTITIPTLAGGLFFGSNPALGTYVFGNIPPLTGADFSGIINNVVQNPADPGFPTGQPSSFQSGDFSFGGASFGFEFLSGPPTGIKLFTDPAVPFSFSAHFNGLPPSQGTVLQNSGPDVLNVLFNGVPVAQTSNRRIVLESIPEPGSLALFSIGLLLVYPCRCRVDPRWTRTKSS
jgi:hypothetical protein